MRFPFMWRVDRDHEVANLALECDRQRRRGDEIIAGLNVQIDDAHNALADHMSMHSTVLDALNRQMQATEAQNAETIALLRSYVAARDEIVQRLDESAKVAGADADRWRDKVLASEALIQKLQSDLAEATKPPEPSKRSRLTDVIRDQSRRPDETIDPGLVRLFSRRARELKRQNKTEDEIIEAIENGWSTTQGQDAVTVDAIVARFAEDDAPAT